MGSDPGVRGELGISGRIARSFVANPLTPILAIMGLLLGVIAVLITPREEEPQIDVTMANVIVPFAGASARDVEQLVSSPLEQKLAEIEGVKHVYSTSRPGLALLTVEYEVGIARQPAVVRGSTTRSTEPRLAAAGMGGAAIDRFRHR
jgi:multidrug efflux pump subunit AcrB